MSPTADMFNGTKPRKQARVMAHMTDCGADAVLFECSKCGWSSGWLRHNYKYSEIKRGIPCEQCNKEANHDN